MSAGMRDADPRVVAKFLDVPLPLVQEQLDAMSPKLAEYMETLFERYVHGE